MAVGFGDAQALVRHANFKVVQPVLAFPRLQNVHGDRVVGLRKLNGVADEVYNNLLSPHFVHFHVVAARVGVKHQVHFLGLRLVAKQLDHRLNDVALETLLFQTRLQFLLL